MPCVRRDGTLFCPSLPCKISRYCGFSEASKREEIVSPLGCSVWIDTGSSGSQRTRWMEKDDLILHMSATWEIGLSYEYNILGTHMRGHH